MTTPLRFTSFCVCLFTPIVFFGAHTDDRRHVPPTDGYVRLRGVDRGETLGRKNREVDEDLRHTSPTDQAVARRPVDEAERDRGGDGGDGAW